MIKWHLIKTKEDVPPASRDYLVTCIIRGHRYVTIDRPYPKYILLGSDWNEWEDSRKVIAWAELPKPFDGALDGPSMGRKFKDGLVTHWIPDPKYKYEMACGIGWAEHHTSNRETVTCKSCLKARWPNV